MDFLVATDGSEESERALADAVEVADAMDARVTVVHAVDPSVYDRGGDEPIGSLGEADQRLVLESVEAAEDRGFEVLEAAADQAAGLGHDVETQLLYGEPAREIVEYANDGGFDAIFVGHRGRSQRASELLGSVARTVVERADVPVTVVR